VISGVSTDESG